MYFFFQFIYLFMGFLVKLVLEPQLGLKMKDGNQTSSNWLLEGWPIESWPPSFKSLYQRPFNLVLFVHEWTYLTLSFMTVNARRQWLMWLVGWLVFVIILILKCQVFPLRSIGPGNGAYQLDKDNYIITTPTFDVFSIEYISFAFSSQTLTKQPIKCFSSDFYQLLCYLMTFPLLVHS
jgi:hypothetical protein